MQGALAFPLRLEIVCGAYNSRSLRQAFIFSCLPFNLVDCVTEHTFTAMSILYNVSISIFVFLSLYLVNSNRGFFFGSGKSFAGIWFTYLVIACCTISLLTDPIWINGTAVISIAAHLLFVIIFRPFTAEYGNLMHATWTLLCGGAACFNYWISRRYHVPYAIYMPIVAGILMFFSMIGSIYTLFPVFDFESDEPFPENLDVGDQMPRTVDLFDREIRYRRH